MKNENEKIDLLIKVYENQQSLISNTDTKSNISIGLQTFVLTTILGASLLGKTLSSVLAYHWLLILIYFVLLISFLSISIIGLTFCVYVFSPRPPQEKKEIKRLGITYFGHISRYKDSEEYHDAIKRLEPSEIIREFSHQNYSLALILNQKMKYLKRSSRFLFISILIGLSFLIYTLLIN
jgi:hypothetical protein